MLLYCQDDTRRSVLSFVIENRGYKVLAGFERDEDIDLAVIVDDLTESETFAQLACEYMPHLPTLVLIRHQVRDGRSYPACVAFVDNKIAIADLMERVRIIAARKRGPKKRGPYGPRVQAQEAVTA